MYDSMLMTISLLPPFTINALAETRVYTTTKEIVLTDAKYVT